ncbi:MAG TPA: CHAD domain-containing protein [Caldimonas sp.]|jgi:inorganic triphosphatase YgiF|nr:CHAD domain-containing protein [Caldimonas sp.]HEX4235158.1 CHAD domain-containing protein [Caldimonas sp.]
MQEIELKFGLADDAAAAVDAALRARGATTAVLESRYWDSADRRLARAGLSLRLRRSAAGWEQTVKAAGKNPAERLEETVPRPGSWSGDAPAPELGLHAGSTAGLLLDAALVAGGRPPVALALVHTTAVRRCALTIETLGAELEVSLDRGLILAGDRSLPICEVEVELKRGSVGALVAVGRANVDVHAMWLSTATKAMRGAALADDGGAAHAVKAAPARFAADARGPAIFRALLRSCVDQVLANASVVAAGDADDEVVHQLRVGLRRLRTAARELADWRGTLGDGWEAACADAFRALGAWRDRRSVAASMQARLAAAGSPAPALGGFGRDADADPDAIVRAPAFQHALLDLLAFLLEPEVDGAGAGSPQVGTEAPSVVVARHLGRLHEQLRRDAKRFAKLDEMRRHRARKRLKRLRYLGELVAPLYKASHVERFARALGPAQDALGRYVDLVVAGRLAREAVDAGDARAWFNVGWLQAQQPRAIERCGKRLRDVVAAEPYWR